MRGVERERGPVTAPRRYFVRDLRAVQARSDREQDNLARSTGLHIDGDIGRAALELDLDLVVGFDCRGFALSDLRSAAHLYGKAVVHRRHCNLPSITSPLHHRAAARAP